MPDLDWVPNTVCTPGQRVLILPTGPADVLDTCVLFFVQAINTAQQRIWITSPYFVPDEMVVAALQLAALRGVDVEIYDAEFISVMGPSGAGKSTLLAILGMLDGDWAGEYYLHHEAVHAMKPKDRIGLNRHYIGFVFQQYHLLDDLTVYENVELPLVYRNAPAALRKERVRKALDEVDMGQRRNHYPAQLSGGQQQRVAIARALVNEPSIILADEPTASLDPKTSRQIMRLIVELCKERNLAAIINIHDVALAQMFVERVIGLELGAVVFDGTPDDLTPDVLTRIYGEEDWEATIEKVDDDDEDIEAAE